jgi:hypothetical protein
VALPRAVVIVVVVFASGGYFAKPHPSATDKSVVDRVVDRLMPNGRLEGATRDAMTAEYLKNCRRKADPNAPADAVDVYCNCVADGVADRATPEDLKAATLTQAFPPETQQMVRELVSVCTRKAGLRLTK